jgi:hypothetical protein
VVWKMTKRGQRARLSGPHEPPRYDVWGARAGQRLPSFPSRLALHLWFAAHLSLLASARSRSTFKVL